MVPLKAVLTMNRKLATLLITTTVITTVLATMASRNARAEEPGTFAMPENVVVLANSNVQESIDIASYYATHRGLPDTNICLLDVPDTFTVSYDKYEQVIAPAVRECLETAGLKEQALYLVPVWGFPAVVVGWGREVDSLTDKSLDSFLCDLYDESLDGLNPYHGKDVPFLRKNGCTGYLVTRLDGPDPESAKALIDRATDPAAVEPGTWGIAYFDQEPVGDGFIDKEVIKNAGHTVNPMLESTSEAFASHGWETVLDDNDAEFGTAPAMTTCPDARFFAGWYSLMDYSDAFAWTPGAIGVHFDSYSAREFRSTDFTCWTAGAIRAGITATAGSVWEPYVSGFIEPDRFLGRMVFDGSSLAEAAWSSIPKLRWMMVVFGDPLFSYARKYPKVTIPDDGPHVEFVENGDIVEGYDAAISDTSTAFDVHDNDITDAIASDKATSNGNDAVSSDSPTSADDGSAAIEDISAANDDLSKTSSNGCSASDSAGGRGSPHTPPFAAILLLIAGAMIIPRFGRQKSR